jgi:hypothetical protein
MFEFAFAFKVKFTAAQIASLARQVAWITAMLLT